MSDSSVVHMIMLLIRSDKFLPTQSTYTHFLLAHSSLLNHLLKGQEHIRILATLQSEIMFPLDDGSQSLSCQFLHGVNCNVSLKVEALCGLAINHLCL